MGVQGLWRLLESTGRPVNMESLEGKVLAVDVSIWLNQALLGAHGNALSNPHLQVLFRRICKLLYYRIRPVFVFDGKAPQLKKRTLAARRQRKELAAAKSAKTAEKIVKNYLKGHALKTVMGDSGGGTSKHVPRLRLPRTSEPDIYELPPIPNNYDQENSEEDEEAEATGDWVTQLSHFESSYQDLRHVDIDSESFKALPVEVQHELITEMQETGKRNSWARMHQLPKESRDFSSFQVEKLLQKSKLSLRLGDLRKEMKTKMSVSMAAMLDSESQMNQVEAGRVVSEDTQHYILIKTNNDDEKNKKNEEESEAAVASFGQKSGFTTSMDIQMAKAMKKRSAVTKGTDDDAVIVNDDSSPARKKFKSKSTQGHSDDGDVICLGDSENVGVNNEQAKSKQELMTEELRKFFKQFDEKMSNESQKESDEVVLIDDSILIEDNDKFTDISKDSSSLGVKVVVNDVEDSIISNSSTLTCTDRTETYHDRNKDNERCQPGRATHDVETPASSLSRQAQGETIEILCDDDSDVVDLDKMSTSDAGGVVGFQDLRTGDDGRRAVDVVHDLETEDDNSNTMTGVCSVDDTGTTGQYIHKNVEPEMKDDTITVDDSDESDDDFVEVVDASLGRAPVEDIFFTDVSNQTSLVDELKQEEIQEISEKLQESDQEPDIDEWQGVNLDDMSAVNEDLENERHVLEVERRKQQTKALSVTDTMYADSKELLRCFGIPFIDSPQEAEAQCAHLDLTNQTQGTITDDSDVWLFGGHRVYKNFFSKKRDPEIFTIGDIEGQLMLTRDKMINLAYLMGSDYTVGVQGVGFVSAMEVLSEFKGQELEPLQAFKAWWDGAQEQLMAPVESQIKAKLRKVTLPGGFPNPQVARAYLSPAVDESQEAFQWGSPDLGLLRELARDRFGWPQSKVDETLLPVLKKLNETQVQRRITSFFSVSYDGESKKITSKRIKRVLKQMGRSGAKEDEEGETDGVQDAEKRKIRKKKGGKLDGQKERVHGGGKKRRGRPKKEEKVEMINDDDGKEDKGINRVDGSMANGKQAACHRRGDGETDERKQGCSLKTQKQKVVHVQEVGENSSDQDDGSDEEECVTVPKREVNMGTSLTNQLWDTSKAKTKMVAASAVKSQSDIVDEKKVNSLVQSTGQKGKQMGKGKRSNSKLRKGKSLMKGKPAAFVGPNLSSSGSDSD